MLTAVGCNNTSLNIYIDFMWYHGFIAINISTYHIPECPSVRERPGSVHSPAGDRQEQHISAGQSLLFCSPPRYAVALSGLDLCSWLAGYFSVHHTVIQRIK